MTNGKKTILIIEDETDLRQLIKSKLMNEGFNILEAGDGKVALETAKSQHPDIILLDIILPTMDGISMLKELRQDEWGKNVPVIILSNLSEAETISESVEKNVCDYLVKADWEPDDIVALIRKKLGKA